MTNTIQKTTDLDSLKFTPVCVDSIGDEGDDHSAVQVSFYDATGDSPAPMWVGVRRAESKAHDGGEAGVYIATRFEVTLAWLTGDESGEFEMDGKNATTSTLWSDDDDFHTFVRSVLPQPLMDRLICDAVVRIVGQAHEAQIIQDGEGITEWYEWVDETLNYLHFPGGESAIEWHNEETHGSYEAYSASPAGLRYGAIHEYCVNELEFIYGVSK